MSTPTKMETATDKTCLVKLSDCAGRNHVITTQRLSEGPSTVVREDACQVLTNGVPLRRSCDQAEETVFVPGEKKRVKIEGWTTLHIQGWGPNRDHVELSVHLQQVRVVSGTKHQFYLGQDYARSEMIKLRVLNLGTQMENITVTSPTTHAQPKGETAPHEK